MSGQSRTCVYVVDDDAAVRRGIERLLRASGHDCRVFDSATAYLGAALEPCEACCLLLDIRMPEITGTELQERLTGTDHECPIIFVTGHGDIPTCVKALKAGAVSFLTKPFDEKDVLAAIKEALQRSLKESGRRQSLAQVRALFDKLSPREREVLSGVVRGLLNKQIGSEMGIAEKTVKVHRARVMTKMAAGSVAELVRMTELLGRSAFGAEEPRHA